MIGTQLNFLDAAINNTRTRRRFQQTNTFYGRRGIGGREGRGNRGGRDWDGKYGGQRNYECKLIGINGTTIKVHLAYRFGHEHWFDILETVCNNLNQM